MDVFYAICAIIIVFIILALLFAWWVQNNEKKERARAVPYIRPRAPAQFRSSVPPSHNVPARRTESKRSNDDDALLNVAALTAINTAVSSPSGFSGGGGESAGGGASSSWSDSSSSSSSCDTSSSSSDSGSSSCDSGSSF